MVLHQKNNLQMIYLLQEEEVVLQGTQNGIHTEQNVSAFSYGRGAEDFANYDVIDNTSIFKYVKEVITK